jgi:hypothetical protein
MHSRHATTISGIFASVEISLIFEVVGKRVAVKQDQRGTKKSGGKFDEW